MSVSPLPLFAAFLALIHCPKLRTHYEGVNEDAPLEPGSGDQAFIPAVFGVIRDIYVSKSVTTVTVVMEMPAGGVENVNKCQHQAVQSTSAVGFV
jgi:hypothetical protein